MENTTVIGQLKEIYADGVAKLADKGQVIWSKMSKSEYSIAGKGLNKAVNLGANERATGNTSESGNLRQAEYENTLFLKIKPRLLTTKVDITEQAMLAATGGDSSAINDLTFAIDEAIATAGKEREAQFFRDGTGRIAQVNGAVSADNVITVDNGVMSHLRVGSYVDIYSGSTKQADSARIGEVDLYANTITLIDKAGNDINVTVSDNAYIFREDIATSDSGSSLEYVGAKLGTDNGTLATSFQEVNRTTYNVFDGITVDAGGTNISDDILQDAMGRCKNIGGVDSVKQKKLIMNSNGQFRKYVGTLTPMKQFANGDKMDSGFEVTPVWNGMEIIESNECGLDELYFIDFSDYKKFILKELDFVDPSKKEHRVSNTLYFEVPLSEYANYGCFTPNRHVRIKNLAKPTYSYS